MFLSYELPIYYYIVEEYKPLQLKGCEAYFS